MSTTFGPPFNFATMAANSATKILGGNLFAAPWDNQTINPSFPSFDTGLTFYPFASLWPNWLRPQIRNLKNRSVNFVRFFMALDLVYSGYVAQSDYNGYINTILSEIRAQGMTIGFCGSTVVYANWGSPTAAAFYPTVASVIQNCLNPNQDIVAYLEPGIQESNINGGQSFDDTLAGLVRSNNITKIPLLASRSDGNFSGFTAANFDLFGHHDYFQGSESGWWQTANNNLANAIATSSGKPILLEEFGFNATGLSGYQSKADYFNTHFETCFGHPQVVGCVIWGSQSKWLVNDGSDWSIYVEPGDGDYNPADVPWADTTASTAVKNWGIANRPLSYSISLNSNLTVTSTLGAAAINVASASVGAPSVSNADTVSYYFNAFNARWNGTFNFTGDSGTTYQVGLMAQDATASDSAPWQFIGTPVTFTGSVSGQAINATGVVPSASNTLKKWRVRVGGVISSGSVNGTLTAITGTLKFGVYGV